MSQEPEPVKSEKWIRVQSDDGDFSIEIPQNYGFFVDPKGFLVSAGVFDYPLHDMQLMNAIVDGSLVSFERYEGSRTSLDVIYQADSKGSDVDRNEKINREGVSIRQIVSKTKESYSVRQYIHSKSHIYILTAASRTGESAAMRRFLDSLVFKPDSKDQPKAGSVLISDLRVTPVEIESKLDPAFETGKSRLCTRDWSISKADVNDKPFVVLLCVFPSFPRPARDGFRRFDPKGAIGHVAMKVVFGPTGLLQRVTIIKTAPFGLQRQAIMAAMRIKFLPRERAGVPEPSDDIVEFGFGTF